MNVFQGSTYTYEENIEVPEWGTKDATHIQTTGGTKGTLTDGPLFYLGDTGGENYAFTLNDVIYDVLLFDKTLPMEWINFWKQITDSSDED